MSSREFIVAGRLPGTFMVNDGSSHEADVNEKVEHVRRTGQSRNHTCHWPGCEKQVPPAMWGCKPHWFKLPKRLRDAIWDTYEIGQEVTMTPSNDYLAVAHEVQEWIRDNYASSGEE